MIVRGLRAEGFMRYELLELSSAARGALSRSAPAGLLLVIWFVVLRLAGALGNFEALLLGLIASSLSTIAVWTLGERLRLGVEKLLFPHHYRMERMVQRVSRRAASLLDLDLLTGLILDELIETVEAPWAGLFLYGEDGSRWRSVDQRSVRLTTRVAAPARAGMGSDDPISRRSASATEARDSAGGFCATVRWGTGSAKAPP